MYSQCTKQGNTTVMIYATSIKGRMTGRTVTKNTTCHSDRPRGPSMQRCVPAKLLVAVKWGVFNWISAQWIWPRRLAVTSAGVRFKLTDNSQHSLPQSPEANTRLHRSPLCAASWTHMCVHNWDAKSINYGEYYSGQLVVHTRRRAAGRNICLCLYKRGTCIRECSVQLMIIAACSLLFLPKKLINRK